MGLNNDAPNGEGTLERKTCTAEARRWLAELANRKIHILELGCHDYGLRAELCSRPAERREST